MPPLRRHSLIMSYYSFIEHGLLPDFTVGVIISTSQSGATKQQLTGIALTEYITKKTGVRWEDVTVNGITASDLDAESFKIFRREAIRSKRMTEWELGHRNTPPKGSGQSPELELTGTKTVKKCRLILDTYENECYYMKLVKANQEKQ